MLTPEDREELIQDLEQTLASEDPKFPYTRIEVVVAKRALSNLRMLRLVPQC